MKKNDITKSRRSFLKTTTAAGIAAASTPMFFTKGAYAADDFRNNPGSAKSITLGFNVPQTGAYADEGADELREFKLLSFVSVAVVVLTLIVKAD